MLQHVAVCCSVLQCVAVCCNVLQYAAVCCSVLQCVAVCCSVLQRAAGNASGSGRGERSSVIRNQIHNFVGKTDHNVGELACILGLTNSYNQSP